MRLFVAVDLDAAARDAMASAAGEMRRRLDPLGVGPSLKWVRPDQLHLTIRFIGEVDDARAARLRAALAEPLAQQPFDVRFEGAGAFPPRGAPRVLWAGVAEGAAQLAGLCDVIEARLRATGEPPDARPFTAHLTLARVRERGRAARADEVRAVLAGVPVSAGPVRVSSITLYESRLSPAGARYEPLLQTTLAAP